jgi:hypothetical protein
LIVVAAIVLMGGYVIYKSGWTPVTRFMSSSTKVSPGLGPAPGMPGPFSPAPAKPERLPPPRPEVAE